MAPTRLQMPWSTQYNVPWVIIILVTVSIACLLGGRHGGCLASFQSFFTKSVIIFILGLKDLRLRGVRYLTQGHVIAKDSHSDPLESKFS